MEWVQAKHPPVKSDKKNKPSYQSIEDSKVVKRDFHKLCL